MALAKTKKRKIRKKLFSEARPSVRKLQREFYSQEQINNFKKIINHDSKIYSKYNNDILIIGLDEVGRGCVAGPVCTGAYSSSSFYLHAKELLEDIIRSRQLTSGEFMSYSDRDLYYSETIINEGSVEEELLEIEDLSALLLLEDSKQVPHAKREKLCNSLLNVPSFSPESHILYSTNQHSAAQIDEQGIVQCIWSSMTENLLNIVMLYFDFYHKYPKEILLLVDGPKTIANIINLLEEKLSKRNISDINFVELNNDPEQQSLGLEISHGSIVLRQQAIVKGDSHSALIAAASNLAKSARDKHMRTLATKHPNYLWENNVGYGTKKHLDAIQTYGMIDEHRRSFLSNYEASELLVDESQLNL